MSKFLSPLAIAGAFLSLPCLDAAPAEAASLVTFVSGAGTNSGTCANPANPCRTFQFAIDQTSPGGEVKALDPANYGAMIIAKSISITGVEGAGIDTSSIDAVTINAKPSDAVNLKHLTLNGLGTAQNGIVLNSGGSLTIAHCAARNFASQGIRLLPTGQTKALIEDTLVSDNLGTGIAISPQGAGSIQAALDHVSANRNSDGISVTGFATSGAPVNVAVVASAATQNGFSGFGVGPHGLLRLARSAATGNNTGVFINTGATVESFGDNNIHGNATDVSSPLTHVGTQ